MENVKEVDWNVNKNENQENKVFHDKTEKEPMEIKAKEHKENCQECAKSKEGKEDSLRR